LQHLPSSFRQNLVTVTSWTQQQHKRLLTISRETFRVEGVCLNRCFVSFRDHLRKLHWIVIYLCSSLYSYFRINKRIKCESSVPGQLWQQVGCTVLYFLNSRLISIAMRLWKWGNASEDRMKESTTVVLESLLAKTEIAWKKHGWFAPTGHIQTPVGAGAGDWDDVWHV